MDARVLPAAHEEASVVQRLDSVESSLAPRQDYSGRVAGVQRVDFTVESLERNYDPTVSLPIPRHSVGSAEDISVGDNTDRAIWSDGEDFVATDVNHADIAHVDARVGNVNRSIGTDCDIVEKHRALRPQINFAQRPAGAFVERAKNVDVGCPKCIAVNREPLRSIERDSIPSANREQRGAPQLTGVDLHDV